MPENPFEPTPAPEPENQSAVSQTPSTPPVGHAVENPVVPTTPSYEEHKERQAVVPPPKRRRSFGCILGLLVLLLMITVPTAVYFLEFTDLGMRVNRKLHRMVGKEMPTGGSAASAAPVEPKVVEKVVEVPVEKIVEKTVEKIVEVPVHRPMPDRFVAPKEIDTAKLYGGLMVKTEFDSVEGETATLERQNDAAYQVEMTLKVRVPKPNRDLESLSALNPKLPEILPDLGRMLATAKVSKFYHELYRLKQERVQRDLTRLNEIPSRHNFFDCETVLELKHPENQGIALMMQGEMDVVADGSDGDRWPKLDDYISMSDHYQPTTSYGWKKTGKTPNPLLARWQADLKKYEAEFAIPGLGVERNRFLRSKIDYIKPRIEEMKFRSFLIAEADPFVVVPISFLGRKDAAPFVPSIGDYAVIIYEDSIYPAIVGDAGPSYKMGEASLRVAQQLNERATVYSRPVSDLKVTYLVFPGSADKPNSAPDLVKWRSRCDELLGGLGGLGEGYSLFEWEDLIAKSKAAEASAKAAEEAARAAQEATRKKAEEEKAAQEKSPDADEPAAVPRPTTPQ